MRSVVTAAAHDLHLADPTQSWAFDVDADLKSFELCFKVYTKKPGDFPTSTKIGIILFTKRPKGGNKKSLGPD